MSNVKKNFAYNILYQLIIIIMPFITAPYISRVLGPGKIGVFSYTHSVASYFVLLAMLGVNNYGNRSVAMVRDDKNDLSYTFWSIYFFQLLTSIISAILYYLYIIYIIEGSKVIAIIQMLYVISAALDINWFYFGLEEFKITVTRNIIIKIVTVCCIFLFVKTSDDLKWYALIMVLGTFLGQLSVWPFVGRYVHFICPHPKDLVQHIRPSLTLFIPVVAISLYKIMDKIMLGSMSNMIEVGLYDNTEKVISIPMGMITALGTVMLPRMSNLVAKGDSTESLKFIEKSMFFVTFMGPALTFGIAGIGMVFAPVFFGEEFRECGKLLMWISPTIMFISWANVIRTQYLIPNQKDKTYIISVLIGAIINITINVMLIRKYGALGAVIGTVAAEASVAVTQTYMVRDELDFKLYLKNGLAFIPIGIVMFIIVKLMGNYFTQSIMTLIAQILVGAVVYLLLSYVYIINTKNSTIVDSLNEFIAHRRERNK